MRKLTAGLFFVLVFAVFATGPIWADEPYSKIPEQDAKMGPAFEPGG